jgi:hypothetical protein
MVFKSYVIPSNPFGCFKHHKAYFDNLFGLVLVSGTTCSFIVAFGIAILLCFGKYNKYLGKKDRKNEIVEFGIQLLANLTKIANASKLSTKNTMSRHCMGVAGNAHPVATRCAFVCILSEPEFTEFTGFPE